MIQGGYSIQMIVHFFKPQAWQSTCPTREQMKRTITANAAGQLPPPTVVYRFVRVPQHIVAGIPQDWAIGKSEKG